MARTHSGCACCKMNQECKECYYQALKRACREIHLVRLNTGGDGLTTERQIERMIWKVQDGDE